MDFATRPYRRNYDPECPALRRQHLAAAGVAADLLPGPAAVRAWLSCPEARMLDASAECAPARTPEVPR